MTQHPAPAPDRDPHQWLEEVTGAEPLEWVHRHNADTDAELSSAPGFEQLQTTLRGILDSDAKIPDVTKRGEYLYNFWTDADHERGLWRRTTLEEYRKPEPAWEILLDLDALNAAEGENWVWHGAEVLRPHYDRALVALSRGGADADVTREFDLTTTDWVADGFYRPEAKGDLTWIDRDHVYAATDFGEGTLSTSGYPRMVKLWTRGTPMEAAAPVFTAEPTDMSAYAVHDDAPGFERDFVVRNVAFYTDEVYLRGTEGDLVKVEAPDSATKSVHHRWLTIRLRDAWTVGTSTYAPGTLLVADFGAFIAGERALHVVFEPTESTSLADYTWVRDHLVLNVLDDVKSRLYAVTPPATDRGEWHTAPLPGVPGIGTVAVAAVDEDESNDVWLYTTDFLTPTTLSLAHIGHDAGPPEALKANPEFFDGSTHTVDQRFASSADGTRVPYFLVRPRDLPFDGTAATLLSGYGGFEISRLPSYSGLVGSGWLESGGVYVVANIRGGGEYGPRWHQAALRENRHRAYEDFAAVARDLVETGVTTPAHLGCIGGSNGGLLVGNMLTQYPDLFGAIVIQVPLLDMYRYSHLLAGASWVAEYGDPDTDDWKFLATFSPYHLFDDDRASDYPPTFLWTTTRDDRVHPGHARKMMAKMAAAGADVRYFENTEGGHGAGATNAQTAHVWALTYAFLRRTLH